VTTALTVTVSYAPSPWLPSREPIVDVPVECVLSKVLERPDKLKLDLATPLVQLPDLTAASRLSFRAALQSALETELGEDVIMPANDRIEWGGRVAKD